MLTDETLQLIVEAARLSPSADNSQPWHLHWNHTELLIAYDANRAKSFLDPDLSMLWIALGAMLQNIETAAKVHGLSIETSLHPPETGSILIRVRFHPHLSQEDPLYEQIPNRCTNRRSYARIPLSQAFIQKTGDIAARHPNAQWTYITDHERLNSLAELIGAFDAFLFAYKPLHEGLFRWIRWSGKAQSETQDGLPIRSLELSAFERIGFRLLSLWPVAALLSFFGIHHLLGFRAIRLYRQSAAFAVLTIPEPRIDTYIDGGKHFQELWLAASAHHIALQPLAGLPLLLRQHALENIHILKNNDQRLIAQMAQKFITLIPECENRLPLMIVRLGEAPPATQRSPRKPIEALFSQED